MPSSLTVFICHNTSLVFISPYCPQTGIFFSLPLTQPVNSSDHNISLNHTLRFVTIHTLDQAPIISQSLPVSSLCYHSPLSTLTSILPTEAKVIFKKNKLYHFRRLFPCSLCSSNTEDFIPVLGSLCLPFPLYEMLLIQTFLEWLFFVLSLLCSNATSEATSENPISDLH